MHSFNHLFHFALAGLYRRQHQHTYIQSGELWQMSFPEALFMRVAYLVAYCMLIS